MIDIKSQMKSIMDAVGALVDEGILSDYVQESQKFSQAFDNTNTFFQDIKLSNTDGDAINIELAIMEVDNVVESYVQVYDYLEKQGGEAPLLPYLKDYLSIHPLFQMQNLEDECNAIYYLSKTINHKYAKEIYVALVLAIQEYMLHFADCKET